MSEDILRIQIQLAKAGYDAGPADGIRGRNTIKAIKQFQTANHLKVDGLVGPNTYSKLFGIKKE